jgi:exonuclease VII large subunit
MYDANQIKDFYQNYRDSLERQYQTNIQSLDQQRKNAQASIMGGANKAGMLYSNFPARAKIQYDQQTYQPAKIKLQNAYQTGLDQLRSNILKYQNSIAQIKESIADINEIN